MLTLLTVKTEPHSRWSVERELRRRVLEAIAAAGIVLPTPGQIQPRAT
jgi:hypothetical protein